MLSLRRKAFSSASGLLVSLVILPGCANSPTAGVLGSSGSTAASRSAVAAARGAVKVTVEKALALQGQLGAVSPATLRPNERRPSTGALAAIRRRDLALIDSMFSGVPAARLHDALANTIDADSGGHLVGMGGARKFKFNSVSVAGSHAAVNVTYEGFSNVKDRDSTGRWVTVLAPTNRLTARIGLDKNGFGRWIITALNQDFVPGYGP
jgi:hypothetical protein